VTGDTFLLLLLAIAILMGISAAWGTQMGRPGGNWAHTLHSVLTGIGVVFVAFPTLLVFYTAAEGVWDAITGWWTTSQWIWPTGREVAQEYVPWFVRWVEGIGVPIVRDVVVWLLELPYAITGPILGLVAFVVAMFVMGIVLDPIDTLVKRYRTFSDEV
jgi:hypothetical protein